MLLMIDNYDSFTFNLVRYFRELGESIEVVRNDAISADDISNRDIEAIIISPGPCTPNEAGVSLEIIRQWAGKIPILGVCLGHQAIGQVFGAKVIKAHRVMHGKVSSITHHGQGLFAELDSPLSVTRYHSLVLEPETLPDNFVVTATAETDRGEVEIMAIEHIELPIWGVQFHPESVLTQYGHELLANFLRLSRLWQSPERAVSG